MKDDMITAVLPVVFTSSFGMKTPNQTFEGYIYKVNRREKGLPFVRGRRKHVAKHRNYRLNLSLCSCYYRQKKKSLPSKNYRHIFVLSPPPKSLPRKNEKPPTAKKLSPYFDFTASAKVVTAQKRKTAYRRKNYRRMALPPRLCPPKKALPTITLI